METLFEVAGYSIPSLIVFATVWVILRQFFKQQAYLQHLKMKQDEGRQALPLKLQAYERLTLFCERIGTEQLYFRISHPDMGGQELKNAMLIAIQQEYEHNMTQQIYISEELWRIIHSVKEQVQQMVAAAKGDSQEAFMNNLGEIKSGLKGDPLHLAKTAIRNEVRTIL